MPTKPKEAFLLGYFKIFDRKYFGPKKTQNGLAQVSEWLQKMFFLVLAENDCGGIE